jgi:hypothetical protein
MYSRVSQPVVPGPLGISNLCLEVGKLSRVLRFCFLMLYSCKFSDFRFFFYFRIGGIQAYTVHIIISLYSIWNRGSSVSKVFDYGLDDRAIEVRSPTKAKNFSSNLCIKTGSGAHPASCPMGNGRPFPGGKARPGSDADHSPQFSAEVVNEELFP